MCSSRCAHVGWGRSWLRQTNLPLAGFETSLRWPGRDIDFFFIRDFFCPSFFLSATLFSRLLFFLYPRLFLLYTRLLLFRSATSFSCLERVLRLRAQITLAVGNMAAASDGRTRLEGKSTPSGSNRFRMISTVSLFTTRE